MLQPVWLCVCRCCRPLRQLYPELVRRCLRRGMRCVCLRTLMVRGEFAMGGALATRGGGVYLPSVTF